MSPLSPAPRAQRCGKVPASEICVVRWLPVYPSADGLFICIEENNATSFLYCKNMAKSITRTCRKDPHSKSGTWHYATAFQVISKFLTCPCRILRHIPLGRRHNLGSCGVSPKVHLGWEEHDEHVEISIDFTDFTEKSSLTGDSSRELGRSWDQFAFPSWATRW